MLRKIVSVILCSFRALLFLASVIMSVISILIAIGIIGARSFYRDLGITDWDGLLTLLSVCAFHLATLFLASSYGAFTNNKKIIKLFAILFLVTFLACIVVTFVFMSNLMDIDNRFKAHLLHAQKKYNWTDASDYAAVFDTPMTQHTDTQLWDKVQHEHECCGFSSYHEWDQFAPSNATYPKSCCARPVVRPDSSTLTCDKDTYEKSCTIALYAPLMLLEFTLIAAVIMSMPIPIVACVSSIEGPRRHETKSELY